MMRPGEGSGLLLSGFHVDCSGNGIIDVHRENSPGASLGFRNDEIEYYLMRYYYLADVHLYTKRTSNFSIQSMNVIRQHNNCDHSTMFETFCSFADGPISTPARADLHGPTSTGPPVRFDTATIELICTLEYSM